eukprot:TRINITY_DN33706_c0_g1_i1.p1 TRINITY_DN33706_c0_g1~~TRINITY_DN33706_c0_g1_i1.p1  ORF type:complete len:338 (-),score=50.19 TRINITY_DN33706_c0_g1_i1:38-1051(-)
MTMDDLKNKMDDLHTCFLNEWQKLAEAKAELKKLQAVHKKFQQDADQITLDVGGQHFICSKSTLMSEPDTMLWVVGSEEFGADLTEEGAIFIDRDPKWFPWILNYLRGNRTQFVDFKDQDCLVAWEGELHQDDLVAGCVPPHLTERSELMVEARYYGIDSLVANINKVARASVTGAGWAEGAVYKWIKPHTVQKAADASCTCVLDRLLTKHHIYHIELHINKAVNLQLLFTQLDMNTVCRYKTAVEDDPAADTPPKPPFLHPEHNVVDIHIDTNAFPFNLTILLNGRKWGPVDSKRQHKVEMLMGVFCTPTGAEISLATFRMGSPGGHPPPPTITEK